MSIGPHAQLVFRHIVNSDDDAIRRAEGLFRQLRPNLPTDFGELAARIVKDGGEFLIAMHDDEIVGAALFRVIATTRCPCRFYVDDLVTHQGLRSLGIGAALMRWLEDEAKRRGAGAIELESGLDRERTHRFYEREGFERFAVSFRKPIRADAVRG